MKPLLLMLSLTVTASCGGTKVQTQGTDKALGADATIEAKMRGDSHVEVSIDIEHLPPPNQGATGMTVHVAWIGPPDAPLPKVGTLEYDADLPAHRVSGLSSNSK